MSESDAALEDMRARVAALRGRVVTQINEVFADLAEAAEDDTTAVLMRIASTFEKERDKALARIKELELELTKRPMHGSKAQHQALIQDAAITLRNAMKGVTDAPISDVGSARVIGQVNKAVVAFDEATKGML